MRLQLFFTLVFHCSFLHAFDYYDEQRVQAQFSNALATVEQILNITRHPQFAADVPHTYQDKYSLAEFLTNTAIAAEVNSLAVMGLTQDQMKKMKGWLNNRQAVNIGFRVKQGCIFLRNESAQVGSGQKVTTTTTNGKDSTVTQQTFNTVTTYFYTWSLSWQLIGYRGTASNSVTNNNNNNLFVVDGRNVSFEVKTTSNYAPNSCVTRTFPNLDIDLTWLFQHLDTTTANNNNLAPVFSIDRGADNCYTPRRNLPVTEAYVFFDSLNTWTTNVLNTLPGWSSPSISLATPIFVPVIPLFDNSCDTSSTTVTTTDDASACNVTLSASDLNAFLAEEQSSFQAAYVEATNSFPPRTNTSTQITVLEAMFVSSLTHQQQITIAYEAGVDSIEGMLRDQLVAAIGKEVSSQDFGDYIRFNNKRLFKPDYKPQDLSYSVRRPEHYPEGVVEILQIPSASSSSSSSPSLPFPIQAFVRTDRPKVPVNSTLSGGTVISLNGPRFLHAAVFYQFGGDDQPSLQLAARARQFSSFVLLVGSMISTNEFSADIAIIVKDKDDLMIPLLLTTIPTPKAFRDAIESLSPEQKAFAQAFRSMQLSNTLFAFAIIQVKPQLEKLMKLPQDSLTKEIQLTQDLMSLFLDYQIPSDLLSFQGDESLVPEKKINYVKQQVAQMNTFIDNEKQQQINAQKQQDALRTSAPSSPPPVFLSQKVNRVMPMASMMSAPMMMADTAPVYLARGGAVNMESSLPPPPPAAPAPAPRLSPTPALVTTANTSPSHPANNNNNNSKQVALKATDYTTIPTTLDARVLEYDEDASLRATVLKTGPNWSRTSQKGLLGIPTTATLSSSTQITERQQAFDLLEALSKSGIMSFDEAEYHVVIGSTQSFDQTLLDTVIQRNENPIDQFERSELIVATTVLGLPAIDLVAADQVPRVAGFTPKLFPETATAPNQ